MFLYNDMMLMNTWWKGRATIAVMLVASLISMIDASAQTNVEPGNPNPRNSKLFPEITGDFEQLEPLHLLRRYQRSQQQDIADYPQPTIYEIQAATYPRDGGLFGFNFNRRKIQQNNQKLEMRQRHLAKLEASNLRKNPAKFKAKLGAFLNQIQNLAASKPRLWKEIEAMNAARSAATSAASNTGGDVENQENSADDTAATSLMTPDGKIDSERSEESGTDNDGSELRRSKSFAFFDTYK
ncbi:unnamed protein product [Notodromas monacha]|uniref:Uncharacterized protein n=1 Tax=Notodromas monacha TaxID=399045 RepID=A0A7R9BSW1_9CRUS|nr:unnamed protein product [Notodromas monacha]CAG0920073.1 unnamed protein product [Notodromas monacha]